MIDSRFLKIVSALRSANLSEREARAEAFIIFEDAFGVSRTDVYADKIRPFTRAEQSYLDEIANRLQRGEPFQYVIGMSRFAGRCYHVAPDVLIPRPETEELVEWVVTDSKDAAPFSLLDAGCGSGCIAISLALTLGQARVSAWDISAEALNIARQNAETLHAEVSFQQADMLSSNASFDIIVSNPPYVRQSERSEMSFQVLDYEPHQALFVPDEDPLLFYHALARLGANSQAVYAEINENLADETALIFNKSGFINVEIRHDLFGKPRLIRACR